MRPCAKLIACSLRFVLHSTRKPRAAGTAVRAAELLSVLSYRCSAGRTRSVLLAIGHLSSPCVSLEMGVRPAALLERLDWRWILAREGLQQVIFRREFQSVGLADVHL